MKDLRMNSTAAAVFGYLNKECLKPSFHTKDMNELLIVEERETRQILKDSERLGP